MTRPARLGEDEGMLATLTSLHLGLFARAFVTLLVIMDPVGNAPIFLSLTKDFDALQRRRASWQASLVAAAVILVFALFGQEILRLLGISIQALEVSGGFILILVSLELLQTSAPAPSAESTANLAFVPLGTPLLAGPGAIAATMVYVREAKSASAQIAVLVALVLAVALVWLGLRGSSLLARVLKDSGIELLSRVVGLLLAAIAVQLVATGAYAWAIHGV